MHTVIYICQIFCQTFKQVDQFATWLPISWFVSELSGYLNTIGHIVDQFICGKTNVHSKYELTLGLDYRCKCAYEDHEFTDLHVDWLNWFVCEWYSDETSWCAHADTDL